MSLIMNRKSNEKQSQYIQIPDQRFEEESEGKRKRRIEGMHQNLPSTQPFYIFLENFNQDKSKWTHRESGG